MTANKNAAPEANRAASNTAFTERHSTTPDPLQGWFDLAKPSRDRKPKNAWKRGKQRGRIDTCLAAHLTLLIVLVLLIVGGRHA